MVDVEVKGDGSLYCDVDATKLWGLSYRTPRLGLSILYPQDDIWKPIGADFLRHVQSWCPVDTGFMRDHNRFVNDQGGVEFWSEATYSVYQEYGTSRMRAQPWFERSIQTAADRYQSKAREIYQRHLELESLLTQAMQLIQNAQSSQQALQAINLLRQALSLATQIQYPTGIIQKLLNQAERLYQRLLEQEQEMVLAGQSSVANEEGGVIPLDLVGMFTNGTLIFPTGRGTNQVQQGLVGSVEGAAAAMLNYSIDGFTQGLIGPGAALGGVAMAYGFALVGTLASMVIGDIFNTQGDNLEHQQAMGGLLTAFGLSDERDTTHHPIGG